MSPLDSARMYARRAAEIAASSGQLMKWWRDLNTLAGKTAEDVMCCCSWKDDQLVADDRLVAEKLGDMLPVVVAFSCLVAHDAGGDVLPAVATEYSRLLHEHYGVRRVEVTTAVPLDDQSRRLIASVVRKMAGPSFTLDERIEPSILGGLVVRVDDRVVDLSVGAKLGALRATFLAGESPL
jgi:ATP synthase F1 delta subunit